MTLQGWMCRWTLMTLIELPRTLEYLAYLGFNIYENESQTSAILGILSFYYNFIINVDSAINQGKYISVTREKRLDLAKKQSSRNVYQCHVIGPKNSGKTTFCRSFIGSGVKVNFKVNRFKKHRSHSSVCVSEIKIG